MIKCIENKGVEVMNLENYIEYLNSGKVIEGGSEIHQYMHILSQEALKLTMKLNNSYHTPEEIRDIFSEIIGKPVDSSFGLFPPFYTDCGKNINVGKNVFINYLQKIFSKKVELEGVNLIFQEAKKLN